MFVFFVACSNSNSSDDLLAEVQDESTIDSNAFVLKDTNITKNAQEQESYKGPCKSCRMDKNKFGNHDYTDDMARDSDHLAGLGAEQLTHRLDSLIHTLDIEWE